MQIGYQSKLKINPLGFPEKNTRDLENLERKNSPSMFVKEIPSEFF